MQKSFQHAKEENIQRWTKKGDTGLTCGLRKDRNDSLVPCRTHTRGKRNPQKWTRTARTQKHAQVIFQRNLFSQKESRAGNVGLRRSTRRHKELEESPDRTETETRLLNPEEMIVVEDR